MLPRGREDFLGELDDVLGDLCVQKLLTAEATQRAQRTKEFGSTGFSCPGQGLRVLVSSRCLAWWKNEGALETWFADNEKRDVASYVSTKE
jgi:hypothetical protein